VKYKHTTEEGMRAALLQTEFRAEPGDVVAAIARRLSRCEDPEQEAAALDGADLVLYTLETFQKFGMLGEGWRGNSWRASFDDDEALRLWEMARARVTALDPRNSELYMALTL
jgi:hypothetical protein